MNYAEPGDVLRKLEGWIKLPLAAVLIHSGTAYSGHYFAYVRDIKRAWYEFNDEKVTLLTSNQSDSDLGFLERVFGGNSSKSETMPLAHRQCRHTDCSI